MIYIYIIYSIYIYIYIYKLKCSFGWQVFLVCPGIDLQSCAIEDILQFLNFVQVEQLQIKFLPSMDMTILYSFVTHHICCSLAYSIKISLVP